jgi:hypothetical protein
VAGAKHIKVLHADGWEIGAEVVLTTSSRDFKAHDKAKIVKIEGNMIELDTQLKHYHWGSASQNETTYGRVDMRTQILYLKRSVHIKCRVQPFNYNDGSQDAEGSIHLENVEMSQCGTAETDKGCLVFNMIRQATSLQTVKNCAIHDGKGYGLTTNIASYFNVDNTIFHGFIEHTI